MCKKSMMCVCVCIQEKPLKMNEDRIRRDNRDSIEHDLFIIYTLCNSMGSDYVMEDDT